LVLNVVAKEVKNDTSTIGWLGGAFINGREHVPQFEED
jgi:hypothetical protein